jgi:uncharacterized protein YoxC
MPHAMNLAMFLQQQQPGHDVHFAGICLLVIAIALVAQAVGVIAVGIYAARFLAKIDGLTNNFEARTTPILVKTNELLETLNPKIKSISENVEQLSYTIRAKADEIGATVTQVNRTVEDINLRSRVQVARADAMVTDAMAATEDFSRTVQHGIRVPLRQVAAIVAGVRAGVETLMERFPFIPRGPRERRGPYDL